jgi:hypothetical protein
MRHLLQTRRGLRVVAVVAAVGIVWATPAVASVPATDATSAAAVTRGQAARWGASWLAKQIRVNGGFIAAFGAPDPTDTAYAVLGLHAAGVGRDEAKQAVKYLKSQLGDPLRSGGSDAPGALAYFILAAHAAGQDPRHFGGSAPTNNLVHRLLATQQASGVDAGLFGVQSPSFDGAFRQGLALAALAAAGVPEGNGKVTAAIAWLEHQQCADGLWLAYRADTTVPCPTPDPTTFVGADTNSTGSALQGLAAFGERPHRSLVLQSLDAIQSADGGFPFLAAPAQSSDPNSTALVIEAILALQNKPTNPMWTESGASPYDALASFQIGCTDITNRGAFFFPGSADPSVLATVQAVPASAAAVLPVPPSNPSPETPRPTCP